MSDPVGTAGAIQYYVNSSTFGGDKDKLFLDTSNVRLGIGTDAPSEKLDVNGAIQCLNELRSTSGNDLKLNAGSANRDISLQVNDVTMMTVQGSSGKVGIGTTSPDALLELETAAASTCILQLKNTAANSYPNLRFLNDAAEWRIYGANGSQADKFVIHGGTNGVLATRLVIDTSGNVGIGTTAPDQKLSVSGNIQVRSGGWFIARSADNAGYSYLKNPSTSGSEIAFHTSGEKMRLLSNGNFGIGTTAPSQKLHLNNSAALTATYQKFTNGTATTGTTLGIDADGDFLINNGEAKEIKLYTNDSQRLTIQSGGNVGIGTNAPFSQFHIKDATDANFTVSCGVASEVRLISINDADNDYKAMKFYGSRFEFLTGNVGIGSASPAAPLDVPRASDYKVIKLGDDITSHYVMTGNADHTLTLTCASYFQAEIVITANQTNGGTYNNLYIRGIWSNNHTSHHWDEIENVGSLGTSTFTITNGQNGATTNSGEWKIVHDYTSGSFAGMTVRITDFYGTHAYTIS